MAIAASKVLRHQSDISSDHRLDAPVRDASQPCRIALIIPTRDAAQHLDHLLPALRIQTLQPDELLVVDSSSTDDTVPRMLDFGARVETVSPRKFNHGGTRRMASQLVQADVLIYLTQDAIPATPDSFKNLVEALLSEKEMGVAYGRQLARPGASLLESHARQFNYPPEGRIKRMTDAPKLGIKTCFSSDAFAAYRTEALQAIGGFPENVIGSEDAYVAAKMLLAGWSVRYAAEAEAIHSHDYALWEEFARYFDIGVFYGRERWIRQHFGAAGREGARFLLSEISALRAKGSLYRVPEVLIRSALKFIGYRLGHMEQILPRVMKRRIGMFSNYWN